jgi:3-keto-5-aminohexanoate cleavage enzyme
MLRLRVAARPEPLTHPHPEYVFDGTIAWTYRIICELASAMRQRGIKPEMELYHGGQYWVFNELLREGLVKPPYLFQFVMGYQTSTFPTPSNLCDLVRELPEQSIFFTCGIGQFQLPMTTMSIILGGHVRVGLEDNVYLRRGQKLTGNGAAVERVVRIARELNREIATPAETRAMLGLSTVPTAAPA